jgi:hypothetical protein
MARRVFFSFHYQDVIDFRANVVRQSWVTKPDREVAGYFDASLWEESRKKGEDSLMRLINDGLDRTSITAVLIGSETYARPWVRYEVLKSVERGNRLLGVHINKVPCKNKQIKQHGPDPFAYLAVQFNSSGDRVEPYGWDGQKWIRDSRVSGWTVRTAQPQNAGQMKQLSTWYKNYCWVEHDGYQNFSGWIGE